MREVTLIVGRSDSDFQALYAEVKKTFAAIDADRSGSESFFQNLSA